MLAVLPARSRASSDAVASELASIVGDRLPSSGRIVLDIPAMAENGATVPVTVEVDSPMTPGDHVKTVHILAEGNPKSRVAAFHFTPSSGRAWVATRIRLAASQTVVVVAEMSDGTVFVERVAVQVSVGGCG